MRSFDQVTTEFELDDRPRHYIKCSSACRTLLAQRCSRTFHGLETKVMLQLLPIKDHEIVTIYHFCQYVSAGNGFSVFVQAEVTARVCFGHAGSQTQKDSR